MYPPKLVSSLAGGQPVRLYAPILPPPTPATDKAGLVIGFRFPGLVTIPNIVITNLNESRLVQESVIPAAPYPLVGEDFILGEYRAVMARREIGRLWQITETEARLSLDDDGLSHPVAAFAGWWDSTWGETDPQIGWRRNPWCWRLTLRRPTAGPRHIEGRVISREAKGLWLSFPDWRPGDARFFTWAELPSAWAAATAGFPIPAGLDENDRLVFGAGIPAAGRRLVTGQVCGRDENGLWLAFPDWNPRKEIYYAWDRLPAGYRRKKKGQTVQAEIDTEAAAVAKLRPKWEDHDAAD